MSEVEEIARRIPLFARVSDLRIAPLQGVISLNNANYRIDADGKEGDYNYLVHASRMFERLTAD